MGDECRIRTICLDTTLREGLSVGYPASPERPRSSTSAVVSGEPRPECPLNRGSCMRNNCRRSELPCPTIHLGGPYLSPGVPRTGLWTVVRGSFLWRAGIREKLTRRELCCWTATKTPGNAPNEGGPCGEPGCVGRGSVFARRRGAARFVVQTPVRESPDTVVGSGQGSSIRPGRR